jgi:hypothetical protein
MVEEKKEKGDATLLDDDVWENSIEISAINRGEPISSECVRPTHSRHAVKDSDDDTVSTNTIIIKVTRRTSQHS